MSPLQNSRWVYGGPRSEGNRDRISVEGIIVGCAAGFPALTVVTALCQLYSTTGRISIIYVPLAVLSAFFCTLTTCLSAYLFVDPRQRRMAVLLGVVLGLALLWSGFSYFVFRSTLFQSAVDYVVALGQQPSGQVRFETLNDGSRTEQLARVQSGTEEQNTEPSIIFLGFLITLLTIPSVLTWSQRHLVATSRFRILLCVTCISWLIVSIAWTRTAPDDAAHRGGGSVSPANTATSVEQQIDLQSPEPDADDHPNADGHGNPIAPFVLAALFTVPVCFSIPFIQLFLTECVDTTRLARTWIVTSVTSLSIIALMAMFAPRLFGDDTRWLSAAGLALTVFSAWVILPLVRDVPTWWTAIHVCGLTWIVAGYGLLGRPWSMTPDQLLRSLGIVTPAVAFTLIHMLLGLYSPKKLVTFEHLCWWSVRAAIVTLSALAYWQPTIAVDILSMVFWTVVLVLPFSSTPPEIVYLRYLAARYSSVRELSGILWGFLRRRPTGQHHDPNWIQNAPSAIEPDAEIIAALPESETVQYCLRAQRNEALDPLTLAVVIVTTIVTAVSYSYWHTSPESMRRQSAGAIVTSLGFLALSGWLLLIRFQSGRQSLVMGNNVVGWWNGTHMEWVIPYDSVRDVFVWNQRLTLREDSGRVVTSRRLAEVWPAANYIESRLLGPKMLSTLNQLDQNGKVDFGPIALSWEGLSVHGRILAWEDVGNLRWNAGRVVIVNGRGSSDWANVSARKVPNPLCLRTTLLYFHAVRVFLSSVTESRTTNPRDLYSVLRSVRGTDEFRLADENTLITAMTEVVRYQFPMCISLQLEATMGKLPNAVNPAPTAIGEAWQALSRSISKSVPIPARLTFLSQSVSEVPYAGIVELHMRELSQ